jgi:hypothetical protein
LPPHWRQKPGEGCPAAEAESAPLARIAAPQAEQCRALLRPVAPHRGQRTPAVGDLAACPGRGAPAPQTLQNRAPGLSGAPHEGHAFRTTQYPYEGPAADVRLAMSAM